VDTDNVDLPAGDRVNPVYDRFGITVFQGDCLKVMRDIPDASISAIVTDPPYGLSQRSTVDTVKAITAWVTGNREYIPVGGGGFMGRAWDRFVPPPAVWDECLRILKPGGWLLSFAGTRMADLMGISIRLAGFEMRDTVESFGGGDATEAVPGAISWIYGTGFP